MAKEDANEKGQKSGKGTQFLSRSLGRKDEGKYAQEKMDEDEEANHDAYVLMGKVDLDDS